MFDNRISSANWNVYHSNQMYTNEIISLIIIIIFFLFNEWYGYLCEYEEINESK